MSNCVSLDLTQCCLSGNQYNQVRIISCPTNHLQLIRHQTFTPQSDKMKLTAWRVLVTVMVMATLFNITVATTTQAVLCAGSGGLLLGVGIGLGK